MEFGIGYRAGIRQRVWEGFCDLGSPSCKCRTWLRPSHVYEKSAAVRFFRSCDPSGGTLEPVGGGVVSVASVWGGF